MMPDAPDSKSIPDMATAKAGVLAVLSTAEANNLTSLSVTSIRRHLHEPTLAIKWPGADKMHHYRNPFRQEQPVTDAALEILEAEKLISPEHISHGKHYMLTPAGRDQLGALLEPYAQQAEPTRIRPIRARQSPSQGRQV